MATVMRTGLKQVADPAVPAAHNHLNSLFAPLVAGDRIFLFDGPRDENGVPYWQVMKGTFPGSNMPLGWVPALDGDVPTLLPYQPPCPSVDGLTAKSLNDVGGLAALICFGNHELTLTGNLKCEHGVIDGIIGGAPCMDSYRWCSLDLQLSVLGESATSVLDGQSLAEVSGSYQITGHFDDPGAQRCTWISFGSSLNGPGGPPEPGPVTACRTMFVATGRTPNE